MYTPFPYAFAYAVTNTLRFCREDNPLHVLTLWSDVETHELIYCQGDVIYQQDVIILVVNNFRHPYLRHKGSHWYARLPNKAVDHNDC